MKQEHIVTVCNSYIGNILLTQTQKGASLLNVCVMMATINGIQHDTLGNSPCPTSTHGVITKAKAS